MYLEMKRIEKYIQPYWDMLYCHAENGLVYC